MNNKVDLYLEEGCGRSPLYRTPQCNIHTWLILKVHVKQKPESIPEELQRKFEELPELKSAFEALTPGRRRGYLLYFSQAKHSKTREWRIDKCRVKIFNGKGLHSAIDLTLAKSGSST